MDKRPGKKLESHDFRELLSSATLYIRSHAVIQCSDYVHMTCKIASVSVGQYQQDVTCILAVNVYTVSLLGIYTVFIKVSVASGM